MADRFLFRDADREGVDKVATRLPLAAWDRNLATIPMNRGKMVHQPGPTVIFEIQRLTRSGRLQRCEPQNVGFRQ